VKNKNIHFEISERKLLLRVFDVCSVLLMLHFVNLVFKFTYFDISTTNFYWTIVLGLYVLIFGSVFEMYNLQVASNQFQITKSVLLTSATTVLIYLLTPIFTPILPSNRLQIIYFFLSVFVALYLWRIFYLKFLASKRFQKNVVLVCDVDQVDELIQGIENVDPNYSIIGFVNTDQNSTSKFQSKIKPIFVDELIDFSRFRSVSEIVIASQKTDGITANLYSQLLNSLENGFIIREYTQVYESITQRIPVQFIAKDFYKFFPFSRSNHNQLYLLFMKIFEIFISVVGILIGIFLMLPIYIFNFIGNRGDLFYTQERVGKNGKIFTIYKFRSMIKNAEAENAVFATTNDYRITPFGKFLRKSRIDEFPQFINILKGDMSVIGPRPERPFFVKEISEIMPFYETRHVVKPGLTGWAQVNYSYGESIEDSLIKLQYDLYYIKHRSVFLDINIMLKTFSTVLFYRGQ
jgi:exopolysaccharide biosynthesis polyprenyl glycosylphosphotransferase